MKKLLKISTLCLFCSIFIIISDVYAFRINIPLCDVFVVYNSKTERVTLTDNESYANNLAAYSDYVKLSQTRDVALAWGLPDSDGFTYYITNDARTITNDPNVKWIFAILGVYPKNTEPYAMLINFPCY